MIDPAKKGSDSTQRYVSEPPYGTDASREPLKHIDGGKDDCFFAEPVDPCNPRSSARDGEVDKLSKVRVVINLPLLQSNLSTADKRPVSEAEVRQFLVDSGFTPDGDGWVVEEEDLGQLDPSEVMHARRLD